jgi:hypothetical protein
MIFISFGAINVIFIVFIHDPTIDDGEVNRQGGGAGIQDGILPATILGIIQLKS